MGGEYPDARRRIRVEEEHEDDLVDLLIDTGIGFSAVSLTDYVITNFQCRELEKKNIPFARVVYDEGEERWVPEDAKTGQRQTTLQAAG